MPKGIATHPKVECVECHKPFSELYIHQHMRKDHLIFQKAQRAHKSAQTRKPIDNLPMPISHTNGHTNGHTNELPTFVRMSQALMLEDRDGHIWLAEKIR